MVTVLEFLVELSIQDDKNQSCVLEQNTQPQVLNRTQTLNPGMLSFLLGKWLWS